MLLELVSRAYRFRSNYKLPTRNPQVKMAKIKGPRMVGDEARSSRPEPSTERQASTQFSALVKGKRERHATSRTGTPRPDNKALSAR